MEQLKRMWAFVMGRMLEASSWAAIGAALVGYGVLDERRWSLILGVLVAILGGVGLREHHSTEGAKAEASPAPAGTGYQPAPGLEGPLTPKPPPANP
jgi:hypothetical protein